MRLPNRVFKLLVALALVLFAGLPASAQTELRAALETQNDFPRALVFRVRVDAPTRLTEARLYFRPEASEFWNSVPVDVEPGSSVEAEYEWFTKNQVLPPNLKLEYYWRFRDADGNTYTTQREWVEYLDIRFDWQRLSDKKVTIMWYDGDETWGRAMYETLPTPMGMIFGQPSPRNNPGLAGKPSPIWALPCKSSGKANTTGCSASFRTKSHIWSSIRHCKVPLQRPPPGSTRDWQCTTSQRCHYGWRSATRLWLRPGNIVRTLATRRPWCRTTRFLRLNRDCRTLPPHSPTRTTCRTIGVIRITRTAYRFTFTRGTHLPLGALLPGAPCSLALRSGSLSLVA